MSRATAELRALAESRGLSFRFIRLREWDFPPSDRGQAGFYALPEDRYSRNPLPGATRTFLGHNLEDAKAAVMQLDPAESPASVAAKSVSSVTASTARRRNRVTA